MPYHDLEPGIVPGRGTASMVPEKEMRVTQRSSIRAFFQGDIRRATRLGWWSQVRYKHPYAVYPSSPSSVWRESKRWHLTQSNAIRCLRRRKARMDAKYARLVRFFDQRESWTVVVDAKSPTNPTLEDHLHGRVGKVVER